MSEPVDLNKLSHLQLQELAAALLNQLSEKDSIIQSKNQEIQFRQAKIDKLTHEIAVLRRIKFAASSERLANEQQASLLDEAIDADLAAIEAELEALRQRGAPTTPNAQTDAPRTPRRTPLPAHLPRTVFRHEPDSTHCGCGAALERMGEDVSERLDYTPGTFSVERHVRGKWVCRCCQTLVQTPVPAHVIDKGIPTTALLADVLVGKYAEHLPLYRQEFIYARAGVPIARSTLSAWVGQCGVALQPLVDALTRVVLAHAVLHADETPVQMLKPGSGKTHRAYIWAYSTGAFEPLRAVVYDFCTSRGGLHAREFLEQWKGQLVCDDYAAYKDLFRNGVTEVGCLAHARRKFFELHEASKRHPGGHGARIHPEDLRGRAAGPGRQSRRAAAGPPADQPPGHGRLARMDDAATRQAHRQFRNGQGLRLQPQALDCVDPLPRRCGAAGGQQPHREPDPTHRNDPFIVHLFVKRLKTLRSGSH